MKSLFKLVALALLAFWLPATLHCDLNAAGISLNTSGEHHDSTCQDSCTRDTCNVVEDASYAKSASSLRVLPPSDSSFTFCLLHLLTAPTPRLTASEPVSFTDDPPALQALHRTWHFVRRTALPARAPDSVV